MEHKKGIITELNRKINLNENVLEKLDTELKKQEEKLNNLELDKTNNKKNVYENNKINKKEFISIMNKELKNIKSILEDYKKEYNNEITNNNILKLTKK